MVFAAGAAAAKAGIVVGARVRGLASLKGYVDTLSAGAGAAASMGSGIFGLSQVMRLFDIAIKKLFSPLGILTSLIFSALAVHQWVTWTRAVRRARLQMSLMGIDARRTSSLLSEMNAVLGYGAAKALFNNGRAISEVAQLTDDWRAKVLELAGILAQTENKEFAAGFADAMARAIRTNSIPALEELKAMFPGLLDSVDTVGEAILLISEHVSALEISNLEKMRTEFDRAKEPVLNLGGAIQNTFAVIPLAGLKALNWLQHDFIGGLSRSFDAFNTDVVTTMDAILGSIYALLSTNDLNAFIETWKSNLSIMKRDWSDFAATLPNPLNVSWIQDIIKFNNAVKVEYAKLTRNIGNILSTFFLETLPYIINTAIPETKAALAAHFHIDEILAGTAFLLNAFFLKLIPSIIVNARTLMATAFNSYLLKPIRDKLDSIRAIIITLFSDGIPGIVGAAASLFALGFSAYLAEPIKNILTLEATSIYKFFKNIIPSTINAAISTVKVTLTNYLHAPIQNILESIILSISGSFIKIIPNLVAGGAGQFIFALGLYLVAPIRNILEFIGKFVLNFFTSTIPSLLFGIPANLLSLGLDGYLGSPIRDMLRAIQSFIGNFFESTIPTHHQIIL